MAAAQAREVQIVPSWSVKVIDPSGKPVVGFRVDENWEFYGLSPKHHGDDSRKTNADGIVVFPEQSFHVSGAAYIAGKASSKLNVHASFGPTGTVRIAPPGYKQSEASYSSEGNVYDQPGAKTSKDKDGFTTVFQFLPLDVFDFIANNDWATVKKMITEKPATAKARNLQGETPLIALSINVFSGANAEMIKLLLAAGADVNAHAKDGTTALHNAAKNYDLTYMEFLLAKGADPKATIHDSVYYTENGFTPLHFILSASPNGLGLAETSAEQKIKGIKCLLAKGAEINAKDATGQTPLHLAAVWGDPKLVAALLDAGADRNIKDSHGQTPLQSIAQYKDVDKIRELLRK